MKRILFYALKEDLLPVLREFESANSLKYVRTGLFQTDNYRTIEHGEQIVDLGRATADSANLSESFLVCRRDALVRVRPVTGGAVQRFAVDQLWNPDTVILTPAGLWNNEVILNGRLGTISDHPSAQLLMRRFNGAIRKSFTKVNAFWVGPKALDYLKDGKRLTVAVQSSREFDLRVPHST